MLDECPAEALEIKENDIYARQLEELDRKADRLIDAFAESADMPSAYLQRSLARLEQERQTIMEAQRREQKRPVMPAVLDFPTLRFDAKKAVAAQFIRRIEVAENSAEIIWNV